MVMPMTSSARTLKSARETAGLTLRQLARRAGTSHSTLAAYEGGHKSPTVATFQRIIEAAGFAVDVRAVPRCRGDEQLSKGDELLEVLALAEQFPARHSRELRAPRFGRQ